MKKYCTDCSSSIRQKKRIAALIFALPVVFQTTPDAHSPRAVKQADVSEFQHMVGAGRDEARAGVERGDALRPPRPALAEARVRAELDGGVLAAMSKSAVKTRIRAMEKQMERDAQKAKMRARPGANSAFLLDVCKADDGVRDALRSRSSASTAAAESDSASDSEQSTGTKHLSVCFF